MNATRITILLVLFKLCRCFHQDLKMCITFGCNSQINFCRSLNLVNFGSTSIEAYVYRHRVSCELNCSYN